MDELGIGKMCLMGSSKFTITLNEEDGFTEIDENNEELMKIIAAFPDRFEVWPTVDPLDPNMLGKFQDLFKRGAAGLKLYIGHGYVNKKGEYMFHTLAMDDPKMLPLYAFCEANYIPVCIHVNPYGGKKGFAEEFIAVLTQFPDMKVIAPHFILSSIASERLRELNWLEWAGTITQAVSAPRPVPPTAIISSPKGINPASRAITLISTQTLKPCPSSLRVDETISAG
jgi:predicted TIM-barrel fold metal-dependent hydrolase